MLKKDHNQNGSVSVVVLVSAVALVILGASLYRYLSLHKPITPISKPTDFNMSIWKSFSGAEVEYYIKYPSDWVASESYAGGDGGFLLNFTLKKGDYSIIYSPPTALTGLCVFPDTDVVALRKITEAQPGYFEQARIDLGKYVEFGGYRRAEYKGTYIICKGNQETGFKYNLPPNADPNVLSIMDKILTTFDWVGTDKINNTSTWKTYTGETAYTKDGSTRFSIKYPSNWTLEGDVLYPFGKTGQIPYTAVTLGGMGREVQKTVAKNLNAGKADYLWNKSGEWVTGFASFIRNNNTYIFYLNDLPAKYSDKYEVIFNKMLESFAYSVQ